MAPREDDGDGSVCIPEKTKTGYWSDEDEAKPKPVLNMSVFKDAMKDSGSLFADLSIEKKQPLQQPVSLKGDSTDLEVHSGLRIRNRGLSREMLSTKLSATRFVRLEALKNAVIGDGVKGSWATIGVLAEKGQPRVSSNSRNYAIWKLSYLDAHTVSLFLFGDAYKEHWKESVGNVVCIFDAKVRHDDKKDGFSLSVSNVNQLTVVGQSVDFAICTGKRKDGTACSVPVNRREGAFCRFHASLARKNLRSKRPELSGGNISSGLSGPWRTVKHTIEKSPEQPLKRAKHRSSTELLQMLSNGDKMTTRPSSQGLRFLASLTENKENKELFNSRKQKHETLDDQISNKKQQCEKTMSKGKRPLKEANKEMVNKEPEVVELDVEIEDDIGNTMAQAMLIFKP